MKRKQPTSSKKGGAESLPAHGLSAAQLRSISQVAKLNKLKLDVRGVNRGPNRVAGSPANEYQARDRLRSPD